MKNSEKLLYSSIARTLFLIVNIVVSFFMMPFIVGKLGDHWYGIWVIIGSIATYYYLLDFGLASAVTRFVTEQIEINNYEKANNIINTALVIYCCVSIIIIVVTFILMLFVKLFVQTNNDILLIRSIILIIGFNMALEFPAKAFAGIIQSHLRYDLQTYSNFISFTISTFSIIYFLGKGYGILSLALITLICNQISNILYYTIAKFLFPSMKIGFKYFKRKIIREVATFSAWAFIIQIAHQIRFKLDAFVIGAIISSTAVTHYFIAARLVEYFMNLIFKATNIMTPSFTMDFARKDMKSLQMKVLLITKINAVLAFFGCGIVIILGKPFIIRWMGIEYVDSYPVLVALIIATTVGIVVNPLDNVLYAINRHRFLAILNMIEAILNLILSLILIYKFGILGVAIATCIPLLIARFFLIPIYTCKKINLSLNLYIKSISNTAIFTVLYLLIVNYLTKNYFYQQNYYTFIIIIGSAIPFYTFGIIAFSFTKDERKTILKVIRK